MVSICEPFKRNAGYIVNIVKGFELMAVTYGNTKKECLKKAEIIKKAFNTNQ